MLSAAAFWMLVCSLGRFFVLLSTVLLSGFLLEVSKLALLSSFALSLCFLFLFRVT